MTPNAKSARWISREFSDLVADVGRDDHRRVDVLIIGSGYGGAIAASTLAGCTEHGRELRVVVLERGREFLPGTFPSRMADLGGQIRGSGLGMTRGGEGLFDIRASGDMSVVLANGLGGGSLINAGVMEIPEAGVFDERWPEGLRGGAALDFKGVQELLGARRAGAGNVISRHEDVGEALLPKTRVLKRMKPCHGEFREAAITVATASTQTSGGVQLDACRLCGDCATGCNHNAKESLDTNLLVTAFRRGARIYCGATVLRLRRAGDRWQVEVAHTDPKLRLKEGATLWLEADKVIVAAGTLGSTEILLRSRKDLALSSALGRGFSGNGDMVSFGYDYGARGDANGVADEDQPVDERNVGPTITGILDIPDLEFRDPDTGRTNRRKIVIEEMAVPGPLRRVFEQVVTTGNTVYSLQEPDCSIHPQSYPENDPFAVHPCKISNTSIFAAMGNDGAEGELRLDGVADDGADGHVEVCWPQARNHPLFAAQTDRIERLAKRAGFRGRTIANPLWRPVPQKMSFLTGDRNGPLLTVHPLGGCRMADCVDDGVVDQYGRVYDPRAADLEQPFHPGLVVLDGSIIPSALGTNPALTIAAVSLRAARHLRDQAWKCERLGNEVPLGPRRPVVEDTAHQIESRSRTPRRTIAEFSERLAGALALQDRGEKHSCHVELTLTYDVVDLHALIAPDADGAVTGAKVQIDPAAASQRGRLRIFRAADWPAYQRACLAGVTRQEREAAEAPALTFAVSGSLSVFSRGKTLALYRMVRSGIAWLENRGWRDLHTPGPEQSLRQKVERVLGLLRLTTRAGEVRRFDYALKIEREINPGHESLAFLRPLGDGREEIAGDKRITYDRPGNPWRQMMELRLTKFPGLVHAQTIRLEPRYFAEHGAPLFRIVEQRDHQEALFDAAALGLYVLRMMLSIHIWSARLPDLPRARQINRLPPDLPGLHRAIHFVDVDVPIEQGPFKGIPVQARLTRYRVRSDHRSDAPPIVMIHGYSASGTTFAHPSLKPSLAGHLAARGRDVWVLDLRSSCGMPTATHPWTFERIALMDIPAAIDVVCQKSGSNDVDVVAHCMGAAMLSMAILSADRDARDVVTARDAKMEDRFRSQRAQLPKRIRRVVLSQVGPALVLSQENIFRAYVGSFFEAAFGPLTYAFRPEPERSLPKLLLDRLLATLPYPDDELCRENSCDLSTSVEYVGTRHRMDAFYGRTFKLANLSADTLDHIDDFFGPISLDTVAQVSHFAQPQVITNRAGRNPFVSAERLQRLWPRATLSIHGRENGLVDLATLDRMAAVMAGNCGFEAVPLDGRGHQDCLIGEGLAGTFDRIADFLSRQGALCPPQPPSFIARTPWLGPLILPGDGGATFISMGAAPELGSPRWACLVPLRYADGRWQRDGASKRHEWNGRSSDWLSVSLEPFTARTGHVAALLLYPQSIAAVDGEDAELQAAADQAIEDALMRFAGDERNVPPGVLVPAVASGAALCVALGACQFPGGILDQKPAYAGWAQLGGALKDRDVSARPDLLVLTGDQIYADSTAGLFDPQQISDRYQRPYEAFWSKDAVREVTRRLPIVTMLDDHEIDDNWEPIPPGYPGAGRNAELRDQGVAAFRKYQRAPSTRGSLWFALEHRGFPMFVLDSRTQRVHRAAGVGGPTDMLGPEQQRALAGWLETMREEKRPKFIVTPALLLPRHLRALPGPELGDRPSDPRTAHLRSDGWDGYPGSLHWLLATIFDEGMRDVIFLSGDEHRGVFTTITLRRGAEQRKLYSIHAPGLYTPYLFANAYPGDFLSPDQFEVPAAARNAAIQCSVVEQLFEGAGFVTVSLEGAGPWKLRCRFPGGVETDPVMLG